jgi:regulation of enolase protein 1 (concanavalin A-like superfamily)
MLSQTTVLALLLPLCLAGAPCAPGSSGPTQAPSQAPAAAEGTPAGSSAERIDLAALPRPRTWMNAAKDFKILSEDSLSITASKQTDIFNDIASGRHVGTAPMFVFPADDTFVLTAALKVDFKQEFDGGFLVVYSDPDHWMKLLFEQSHYGPYSVGSTVTDVHSDGSANADVAGNEVFLRLTRAKDVFGFYYSLDGKKWIYIRYFRFSVKGPLKVGFGSQSPLGEQCTTVFSRIRYSPRPTRDYWTGEPDEEGAKGG